ncbi:hypothetical protein AB0B51_23685, partial [Streptomyces griseus]
SADLPACQRCSVLAPPCANPAQKGVQCVFRRTMAKGHREDCKKLQQALMDYAQSNDWDRDFQINLPLVPKKDRDEARPTDDEIERSSCLDRPSNAKVDG